MSCIEKVSKQKKLKEIQKSIYQMISLNVQKGDTAAKEQQIDQIRKQLRKIAHPTKKHLGSLDFNKENFPHFFKKSDSFKDQWVKSIKTELKREILPLIKQNPKENPKGKEDNLQLIQIKCNQSPIFSRKVKTETCDFILNRRKKVGKKQNEKSQEQNQISCSNYLFVKSQKLQGSIRVFDRYSLSEQLKCLKNKPDDLTASVKQSDREDLPDAIQEEWGHQSSKNKGHLRQLKANSLQSIPRPEKQTAHIQLTEQKPRQKKSPQHKLKLNKKPQEQAQQASRYKDFIVLIGLNNSFLTCAQGPYKFYIGKGNNNELPRRLMRRRKWVQTTNMLQANLVWTQRREESYIKLLTKQYLETVDQINTKSLILLIENNNEKVANCKKILQHLQEERAIKYGILQKISNKHEQKIIFEDGQYLRIKCQLANQVKIHNHFAYHHQIAYKKQLFNNIKAYCETKNMDPFKFIPLTFHIQSVTDPQWHLFMKKYESQSKQGQNFWIIKPGENTNRGTGIKVEKDLNEIKKTIDEMIKVDQGQSSTVIVQQYIMPLLYNKRKFDIRCYVLVTAIGRNLKAYWYEQGYIRTSCKPFTLSNIQSKYIHLTNDAVQKHCSDYGKYEPGNKISFETLSKYIQKLDPNVNFYSDIYRQMVNISRDAFEATYLKLHQPDKNFSFEVFGLDFMIDEHYKVWLIEVNRNPCLETSTFLLDRIISHMLQNAFKIAIDPILPPSDEVLKNLQIKNGNPFSENKFKLILDKELPQNSIHHRDSINQSSSQDEE